MHLKSSILFLALFLAAPWVHSQPVRDRDREEFASAMAKITDNMSEIEVLNLLGKPDDIRTEVDPGGISRVGTQEIWCYGTKGHLGFPTLGCVYINKNGITQESFGGEGHPPKPGMFTEAQLQDLLRLLDTAPGLVGDGYNPLPLIRIVNTLQPLGKEKALAAIGEYIRVSDAWSFFESPRGGMFLVLRTLFDLPDNADPYSAGGFGAPVPPPPKDPNRIPRYPIVVVDDIPLMLASGYELEGMATPMETFVEFYQVHGTIRSHPLVPGNDPLAAVSHLVKSRQWIYSDLSLQDTNYAMIFPDQDVREQAMLMEQLLRLTDSVYRMPADALGNRLPCGEPPDLAWQKVVSDVSALKIKWDPRQNRYVFHDGTHLPELEKKIYQRQIWKLNGLGFNDANLVLERRSEEWLDVQVYYTQMAGATLRPANLLLFAGDPKQNPLLTFSFTNKMGNGSCCSESSIIHFLPGSAVQAKLITNDGKTNTSPIFIP
jgi:hypothetical protein